MPERPPLQAYYRSVAWLLLIPGGYLALLLAVGALGLRPFRVPLFLSPGMMGTPQEEIEFETADGVRLRAWWIPRQGSTTVAVLGHGYFLNRSELAPVAWMLWQAGCSCLLFDFRAHGRSGGGRTGLGWRETADVRAAVAAARSRAPGARIVLMGNSMGAAAAVLAAADDPSLADALVLDSAYGRLDKAVRGFWVFFAGRAIGAILAPTLHATWWMAGFNPFRVDLAKAVARVPRPVLFLHGDSDVVARPEDAERNLASSQNGQIVWFEGCDHSEGRWVHPQKYQDALLAFLRAHALIGPGEP